MKNTSFFPSLLFRCLLWGELSQWNSVWYSVLIRMYYLGNISHRRQLEGKCFFSSTLTRAFLQGSSTTLFYLYDPKYPRKYHILNTIVWYLLHKLGLKKSTMQLNYFISSTTGRNQNILILGVDFMKCLITSTKYGC